MLRALHTITGKLVARVLPALSIILLSVCFAHAQQPVAAFSANQVSGCAPLSVRFTDESSGNPVFWNWDLGNGQLSTLKNPTAVYSTPGTYSVTLVVRNADGTNGITKTDFITVYASPKANFSVNRSIVCLPGSVQFTDLSVPQGSPINSWFWDFGDGSTSTQQNPSKTYSTAGFYTVTLRVSTAGGCQGVVTKSRLVRVVSGVNADFSFGDPSTCRPPYPVSFNNLSSGPGSITYSWNFGNGSSSTQADPLANFSAPGNYNVRLRASSEYGCADTISKIVTIQSRTTFINSPDSVCLNTTASFINNSTPDPISSIWEFGNGRQSNLKNDTSSYSSPGNYQVRLINNYSNCVDSAIKTIYVRPLPVVNFNASNPVSCKVPVTVNFNDLSPDASSWQWDFGDAGSATQQNPAHTYNNEGDYNVTLRITDSKGCSNSISKNAFIKVKSPVVNIKNLPAGICAGQAVSPTAYVSTVDGVASYSWDFGDGTGSTGISPPPQTYPATGNYVISLTVNTNGGCSVTSQQVLKVGTPVPVDFNTSNSSACASDSVGFTNLSGAGFEYLWDFGDGYSSILENPKHKYYDTGYFDVTLTVINHGCPNFITKPQLVRILPPLAAFGFSVDCNDKISVSFNNVSRVDPSMPPLSYSWTFGDGGSDNTASPVHHFPSLGAYTVKLAITNGACSSSADSTIRLVGEKANFSISNNDICRGQSVSFSANGSNPANISNYEWFVQGVSVASGAGQRIYSRSFNSNGIFSIGLVITDINGCTDTLIKNNALKVGGPTAGFSVAEIACRNATVSFTDLSAGKIKSHTWDFGDGNIATLTAPYQHQYADTGLYTVKLTVEDSAGCQNSYSMPNPIQITHPSVNFSADGTQICPGADVVFSNFSNGIRYQSLWLFGDGNSSTDNNPVYSYNGGDSVYSVKLIITDSLGCTDSVTRKNYIRVIKPKPAFSLADTAAVCILLNTKFTLEAKDYESFYWDFGDGSTSTLPNPNHFYNSFGDYTAKLFVRGYGGCLDSASAYIHVYNPNTSTQINYSPLNACNSLKVDFSISPPPDTWFAFYGGGDGYIDSSQTKQFSHLYKSFGFYSPYVVLRDQQSCIANVLGNKTIRILGALPFFGINEKNYCDSGTVLLANYTIANDTVISSTWNFGDGQSSTLKNPSHTYAQPGTYYLSLTANTISGCTNTIQDTVRIYRTPNPVILSDSIVCLGTPLQLLGNVQPADTAISWLWNWGNGQSSTEQNPVVQFSSTGNYPVSLQASNKLGCQGIVNSNIRVPDLPAINILNNPVIPVGTGINLPVSYSTGIVSYNWTPNKNLSCTNCPVPYADPKFNTTYKISVTDQYGCSVEDTIMVTVTCGNNNFFVPNTFSPNNDGHNDIFYPRGSGLSRVQSLRIYNRWGQTVFERRNFMANDPSAGWDGKFQQKPAAPGVYVYVIEFICDNGAIIPSRGNVALIR